MAVRIFHLFLSITVIGSILCSATNPKDLLEFGEGTSISMESGNREVAEAFVIQSDYPLTVSVYHFLGEEWEPEEQDDTKIKTACTSLNPLSQKIFSGLKELVFTDANSITVWRHLPLFILFEVFRL